MGRRDATLIGNELIAQGKHLSTPVIVMQSVSTSKQRKIELTLQQMAGGDLNSWFEDDLPVLVLIGEAFRSDVQNRMQNIEIFSDSRLSA